MLIVNILLCCFVRQFFNIWTLREYLALDLRILNQELTMEADLERLIDDFVFMCLFVGNDFLPGIPSLDISKGAISELLSIYIKGFVERGGYLTDSFKVDLKRVKHFLEAVNHEIIFIKCGKTCGGKTRARKKRHMGKAEIDLKRNYYNQKFGAKSKDDRERIRTDAKGFVGSCVITTKECAHGSGMCYIFLFYHKFSHSFFYTLLIFYNVVALVRLSCLFN
ncbi:hypothetical protein Patl1_24309 [Pistacia atlantica]|uniref:Uncharacterized protein n=1 Tax=Pistacia atlantica TaxID=434234 RepID=A0ACC0ZUV1_9ROSI|nr:hypothetical protein Patl1_24309 [Pistacia atlantica]